MPTPEVQALGTAVTNLETKVTAATTVNASAVILLNGLGDLMRANADNPPAIRALADSVSNKAGEIEMSANDLAAAITANTPAATQ